jgi:hypothetical protein
LEISSAEDKEARWYKYRNASEKKIKPFFAKMSVEKLVLRRTFALSVRRREGKLVLLEVQAKVRKIPAIIGYNDSNRVEIWTHPQFLFGEECSVSCLPQPESEDGKIKVLLSQEVDIDELEEDERSPERDAAMEEEQEEGEIVDEEEEEIYEEREELEEGEIVDEEEEEIYEEREEAGEEENSDQMVPCRWESLVPYADTDEDSNDTIINPHNPI